MLIDKRANYYLKRTRASAKEVEFDVPFDLRAKKDVNIEELFPLAIACIADLSAGIVRGNIKVEQAKEHSKELYFAAKFYDAFLYIDKSENIEDKNYFYLVGAIAYYLCDQIGSSLVLARKIDSTTLSLSANKLDILLCEMLQNKDFIRFPYESDSLINKYIQQFLAQYNTLMTKGVVLDFDWINQFKNTVYSTENYRDIFLIDALLAIFILKANYSIFNLLPKYSPISLESLVEIVQSNHFVKEMWPSQRYMCELGFFNGISGVVQMPTGAGKTKAVAMAIYSAFCANKRLSVVIAPFRALCREISEDLKRDLSFDANIFISEISDLIQTDYSIDDLYNSERKTVVVATPEKFLFILRQDNSIIEYIGQLIFDEGHLFDDEDRGATYELLIASILNNINPDTQKILISAIIRNVEEISSWFAGESGVSFKGDLISSVDKLPAALHFVNKQYCYLYYIDRENYDSYDFYVPRIVDIRLLAKKEKERSAKYFPAVDVSKEQMKEPNDMAIACLLKVVDRDNAAIFCGRKDSANKILERIIELKNRNYDVSTLLKRADADEVVRIANLIEHNYGKENPLYDAAILGIFAHHRGITDGIKNAIEYALKHNYITNVVCTSTLAQGVNLPIKYLIISSIYQSNEQIKVRDFHNLIGRTARAGMFTEGTIIFSDPFAYGSLKNRWKWRKYKYLLKPENSEACSSVLLDLVKAKSINGVEYNFFCLIMLYYEDRERYIEEVNKLLKEIPDEAKNWFKHIINTLGKLENYIAVSIADNANSHSDEFVDKMLKGTLAETLATDKEKNDLKLIFTKLCEYIDSILAEENSKRIFAKSLISSDDYLSLQNEILSANIFNLKDDDLLEYIINIIMTYGASHNLHKIDDVNHVVEIAKMWIKGYSYFVIHETALWCDFKIKRRGEYKQIAIEDIVSICDDDFGYSASLIISSICEILANIKESDDLGALIEKLQRIGQSLKYGLSKQTEIFIYELGFNDRYLAQEIAKIIGAKTKKKDVVFAITRNRDNIGKLLQQFPRLFQDRLKALQ